MTLLVSLGLLANFAALVFSVPTVDLLIDHGFQNSGTVDLQDTLASVSDRKGQQFHFGSTLNIAIPHPGWPEKIFSTFFNHVVAENGCKWAAVEQVKGKTNLTDCLDVLDFAHNLSNSFRGHNTFWHQALPTWLPGNFTARELVEDIIPTHVRQEIEGMGNSVTSWDVVNEVVGGNVTSGMTPLECVQNKNAWPTVTVDGSNTSLVEDLSFLYVAFRTAYEAAGPDTRLAINDYNTGGKDAKTECNIALLKDIQNNTEIPFNRLAIGFQSHVQATKFVNKSDLADTFAVLADLGVEAMVTEIDIQLDSNAEEDLRFQAAIWGDYVDVCLFASNCKEFLGWDTRDDESWLGVDGVATLHDQNGNPKPAAYEVAARLAHYASGGTELCASALGIEICKVASST